MFVAMGPSGLSLLTSFPHAEHVVFLQVSRTSVGTVVSCVHGHLSLDQCTTNLTRPGETDAGQACIIAPRSRLSGASVSGTQC